MSRTGVHRTSTKEICMAVPENNHHEITGLPTDDTGPIKNECKEIEKPLHKGGLKLIGMGTSLPHNMFDGPLNVHGMGRKNFLQIQGELHV